MDNRIRATADGVLKTALCGTYLSELTSGHKPCGGHGACGKCKVLASGALSAPTDAEKRLLSPDELLRGVRLACQTQALGDCEITSLAKETGVMSVTDGILPAFSLSATFREYGAAIDLGTTTLAARLYDRNGALLSTTSLPNPQRTHGADVISRIESACDGQLQALSRAVRLALDHLLTELARSGGVRTEQIERVVVTGNTVMLSLAAEEDLEPFSHAPFCAKRLFDETLCARSLSLASLNPDTPIYFPPCISAFLGADLVCAILATGLCTKKTAVLADVGTNGEIALWHEGKLSACSTAAGPAFEGVGISMGMLCAEGAIDRVCIEKGTLKVHTVGEGTPKGICGSGLIDAVACLLELGILDESGYLEADKFPIAPPVCITPKDLRMLQLAKSAICAGVQTLLHENTLTPTDVSDFFLAGGFGNELNRENAARIGLLPKLLAERALPVGNAALVGAAMLLLNKEACEQARSIAKSAQVSDLSASSVFTERYTLGMALEEQP